VNNQPKENSQEASKGIAVNIKGKTIAVTGTFSFADRDLMETRINSQGAIFTGNKTFDILLVGSKPTAHKVTAAKAKNVTIIKEEEANKLFGTPLASYVSRLVEVVKKTCEANKARLLYKYIGEPATEKEITEVEAKLGFPLDPALRAFYQQANGISLGYRGPVKGETKEPPQKEPLDINFFLDSVSREPVWQAKPGTYKFAATMNIPKLQDLFKGNNFTGMLVQDAGSDKLKIGRKTYAAKDFYSNLFLFDGIYGYQPVFIHVDKKQTQVVVGHDHGVCFTDVPPSGVEAYLESAITERLMYRRFPKSRIPTWWRD
jgi:hypothetical protein